MPGGEVVAIEFTSSELALLAQEAADCGLAVGEFVHDAALIRSAQRILDRTGVEGVEELAAAAQRGAAMPVGPRFNRLG